MAEQSAIPQLPLQQTYHSLTPWLAFKRRTVVRAIRWGLKRQPWAQSQRDLAIDLFTPLVPKDIDVFRYSAAYARKYVRHPIRKHFVVGPESRDLLDLCKELGCDFVPEAELLGFDLEGLIERCNDGQPFERAGWLYQQLLKLSVNQLSDREACLILDGDTVFVSPVAFEENGRFILNITDGYAAEYDPSTSKLLGSKRLSSFSFVAHHMLFRMNLLRGLHEHLEQRFKLPWIDAILQNLDLKSFFPLSEYELYANWALMQDRKHHKVEYWHNEAVQLPMDRERIESLLQPLEGKKKTVSLHHYNRERPASAVSASLQKFPNRT